jgi:DNA-binding MarR family transcriptional regulator
MEKPKGKAYGSPAFLLAQVGAHASAQFAERLAQLELAPPHAGILRLLHSTPGLSQQRLAEILSIHPSRLVAIIDELENRKLVVRRENADDRRSHSLHLTERGTSTLADIGRVAKEHGAALCAALQPEERDELARLLALIANQQGLTPGVHPGYRRMGPPPSDKEG